MMSRPGRWLTIAVGMGLWAIHTLGVGAPIDCARRLSRVEQLICSSQGVLALDRVMADEYRRAVTRTLPSTRVEQSQKVWLATTRQSCIDVSCLIRVYDARITALQAVENSPPKAPDAKDVDTWLGNSIPPIDVPKAPPKRTETAAVALQSVQQPFTIQNSHAGEGGSYPSQQRVQQSPALTAPPIPANASTSSQRNSRDQKQGSGGEGAAFIAAALIILAQAITPKRDRRFKTGYKENRTVPSAVPLLYLFAVVVGIYAFVA